MRSFPSGLVTLDVMQYGKEESGEELAVSKDVWFYYTLYVPHFKPVKILLFHSSQNKCLTVTVVLNAVMKGFYNSWAREMAN